jgi:predicted Fe-S protein YdhL (DUF1289 family)
VYVRTAYIHAVAKNKVAAAMAKMRWSKTTKAQRSAVARQLNEAKRRLKEAREAEPTPDALAS